MITRHFNAKSIPLATRVWSQPVNCFSQSSEIHSEFGRKSSNLIQVLNQARYVLSAELSESKFFYGIESKLLLICSKVSRMKAQSRITHISFTRNGKVVYCPLDPKGKLMNNKGVSFVARAPTPAPLVSQDKLPGRHDYFPDAVSQGPSGSIPEVEANESVFPIFDFLEPVFPLEILDNPFTLEPPMPQADWWKSGSVSGEGSEILDPSKWFFAGFD
jgi:hypothetical protein